MSGLTMSEGGLRDRMVAKEHAAIAAGATSEDIALARDSGMDARDVRFLRSFTAARKLLIVFRCPKRSARAFHGDMPAKTFATKAKTNGTGTVVGHGGTLMVSDYDMMSIWRSTGSGFLKVFTSALVPGAPRGKWSAEARDIVRGMNGSLVTKLQHGCQDDFLDSAKNPGVKMADHFLAIRMGVGTYLRDPQVCENYYRAYALWWPYDSRGVHSGRDCGA